MLHDAPQVHQVRPRGAPFSGHTRLTLTGVGFVDTGELRVRLALNEPVLVDSRNVSFDAATHSISFDHKISAMRHFREPGTVFELGCTDCAGSAGVYVVASLSEDGKNMTLASGKKLTVN